MAIRKKKTAKKAAPAKKTAVKKVAKKKAVAKKAPAKKAVVAKKKVAKKAVAKKITKKKVAAKAVRKTAKKAAPKMAKKKMVKKAAVKKVAKKATRKVVAPKVSKTEAVAARKATHAAMKKALKLANQAREDGVYGGGPSFSAQRGHPTAESEAHQAAQAPTPDVHDDRAHIEQVVAKNVQGHIAAQVRRSQGQRDNR